METGLLFNLFYSSTGSAGYEVSLDVVGTRNLLIATALLCSVVGLKHIVYSYIDS